MKKILTVSLVAFMAVSAAHADIASKTYVDNAIGGLDVEDERVVGQYVVAVSEEDGMVATEKIPFDKVVNNQSTHDNAPTSRAVFDAINEVSSVVDGKPWEDPIEELDGRVTANEGAINALNTKVGEKDVATQISEATSSLSSDTTDLKTRMSTAESGLSAVQELSATNEAAIETLDADIDEKQGKSNVAYALGTGAGNWINLMTSLPTACSTGTDTCTLVAQKGKMYWEVVAGGTTVDTSAEIKATAAAAQN